MADAERLVADLPGARVVERVVTERDLRELRRRADPECVGFADRWLERRFSGDLGYGERESLEL